MKLKEQLLTVTAAYCAGSHIGEARLSTVIYGSGATLKRLRAGKDALSGTIEFGLQWLSDNWPDLTATWPISVPRPAPSPGSAAHERLSAPAPIAA